MKKLYLVHVEQTKRIEFLENQVQELKVGMDKAEERNVELNVKLECLLLNWKNDVKHILAERNYLDDKLSEIHSRHTVRNKWHYVI
mgnify:CR=1 FL=1